LHAEGLLVDIAVILQTLDTQHKTKLSTLKPLPDVPLFVMDMVRVVAPEGTVKVCGVANALMYVELVGVAVVTFGGSVPISKSKLTVPGLFVPLPKVPTLNCNVTDEQEATLNAEVVTMSLFPPDGISSRTYPPELYIVFVAFPFTEAHPEGKLVAKFSLLKTVEPAGHWPKT